MPAVSRLATVLRALRRGGCAALPVISVTGDDLAASLARLRNTLWGGGARLPEEVAAALTAAGFTHVQVRSAGSTRHAIFARRPE